MKTKGKQEKYIHEAIVQQLFSQTTEGRKVRFGSKMPGVADVKKGCKEGCGQKYVCSGAQEVVCV